MKRVRGCIRDVAYLGDFEAGMINRVLQHTQMIWYDHVVPSKNVVFHNI